MRLQARYGVVVTLLAAGCGGTTEAPVGPAVEETAFGAITLRNALPERLSGTFVRDRVAVDFDSIRTAEVFRFEIRSGDGKLVIDGGRRGEDYYTSLLGGKAEVVFTKVIAEAVRNGDAPPILSDENMQLRGDVAVLEQVEKLPEYTVLPWLSRTLGEKGYNGRDYPAALALHQFGRGVAERLNVQVPRLDKQLTDESSYCQAYPNQGNGCYGMCGPGCSCWSWVCGDCCYHGGCARHDSWCRGHGFWNGVACYTAFVAAAFGC